MADVTSSQAHQFHRKPLNYPINPNFPQPYQLKVQATPISVSPSQPPQQVSSHSHARTASSSIFPTSPTFSQAPTTLNQDRRIPSTATISSMASKGDPVRSPSSVSVALRRSASVRSGMSFVPTSYVALMRKQKATVWCDRAQLEDPRKVAEAKEAKHRAALEVSGGNIPRLSTSTSGGSSSLGVRSKITNRYNLAKPVGYSANLLGTTGVPLRLSATEVGDEEKDGKDAFGDFHGRRSGSGRSSLQNAARLNNTMHARMSSRMSIDSTPPREPSVSPPVPTTPVSATTTMVNKRRTIGEDYFQQPHGNGSSESSGEETRFGDIGDMKAPRFQLEGKSADELARRGSVDERAATMRGAVKLFVANPDLSD